MRRWIRQRMRNAWTFITCAPLGLPFTYESEEEIGTQLRLDAHVRTYIGPDGKVWFLSARPRAAG